MRANPVSYSNFIIHVQNEYCVASQTVVTRCLLKTLANGEQRGFTEIETLLDALRAELLALQSGIIPCEQENQKG